MFGTVLISAITIMHIYVFWRVASIPFVVRFVPRQNSCWDRNGPVWYFLLRQDIRASTDRHSCRDSRISGHELDGCNIPDLHFAIFY